MPFKESCIPFLDAIDPSAKVIDSVNTIVNDDGKLTGLNTDYIAVKSLIASHRLDTNARVMIQGSGGMGKAVIAAFRDAGFRDVIIAARNRQRGRRWQNSMAFSGSPCRKDRSRDSGQCHTAGHGGERKATRWRSARPWWTGQRRV